MEPNQEPTHITYTNITSSTQAYFFSKHYAVLRVGIQPNSHQILATTLSSYITRYYLSNFQHIRNKLNVNTNFAVSF